jgi:cytochrome c
MMTIHTLALLSAASLIVVLARGPATAAEFASKDDAISMVKKAVAFIKEQGPDKAYAEFSNKAGRFHDRDLYITTSPSSISTARSSPTARERTS